MKKILVMGLPGAGKTFFSKELHRRFTEFQHDGHGLAVKWFNADEVRRLHNDWDFSPEGRIRQSLRMAELAEKYHDHDYVICDFVAPLPEMRDNFAADWTVWMDTIDAGRFEDTNRMFVEPTHYDFRITEQDCEKWAEFVLQHILEDRRRPRFDWRRETVQMLGRWQPWHAGHRALFERAVAKTGQVIIQIRDCQGWMGSNPFAVDEVRRRIMRDLDPIYQGQYEIMLVPNIVNITYGRDVGYRIEQETFTDEIHSISATKIRREMGIE
jgi:hypothetical protein